MNEDPISSATEAAQRYVGQTGEQVREKADTFADQAQNYAGQIRGQAEQVAGQIREQAGQVVGQVREGAQRAFEQGDYYVRENPWTTILGAAGIGLVIGFALAHRSEPTFRQRYLDEPSDHARDLLHSLLGRLGKDYSHARSTIDDVADDSARHASKLVRKLRFW